jgi:cytochrome P450
MDDPTMDPGATGTQEAAVERCPVDHGTAALPAKPAQPAQPAAILATALPGPRMHPMVQILNYWFRQPKFVEKCHERYGSRFALTIRVPPNPLYVLSEPEDIKQMFLAPADVLHTGKGSATIEKFLGHTSLACMDENEHKTRRRTLMPTMHGKALDRITASVNTMVKQCIAEWPHDIPVPLHPHIHRFTLQVIREVVFGAKVPSCWDEMHDRLHDLMSLNDHISSAMIFHKMSPRAVKLLARIPALGVGSFLEQRDRVDALIAEAVEERRNSGFVGDDLLSVLLGITHEDGSPLTAVELRDEMMTIFFAGTETTVVALSWGFEYLSLDVNRPVLDRLVAEIDAGVSEEYLNATVYEILRVRPSIPQIIPRTVMKPIEIGGVRYEPGMLLWASAYLLHRNPELYPDPYAFRPERFLDTKPGIYTWIPFGGGRIRCLGANIGLIEMAAVLREVLARYELVRDDPKPERPRSRSVSTRPARGPRLTLRTRKPEPSLAG